MGVLGKQKKKKGKKYFKSNFYLCLCCSAQRAAPASPSGTSGLGLKKPNQEKLKKWQKSQFCVGKRDRREPQRDSEWPRAPSQGAKRTVRKKEEQKIPTENLEGNSRWEIQERFLVPVPLFGALSAFPCSSAFLPSLSATFLLRGRKVFPASERHKRRNSFRIFLCRRVF